MLILDIIIKSTDNVVNDYDNRILVREFTILYLMSDAYMRQ